MRIAAAGQVICWRFAAPVTDSKSLVAQQPTHGHPTARTADLSQSAAAALFDRVIAGQADAAEQELFRGQMLTEMARMSIEDGFVMQLHPGSRRNHNHQEIFTQFRPRCGGG